MPIIDDDSEYGGPNREMWARITGRKLGLLFRRTAQGAAAAPLRTASAVITASLCYFVAGTLYLSAKNLASSAERWSRRAQMTVYLRDGTPPARGQALADALATVPGIERTRWISAPEAERRLVAALGPHRGVLAGVETGFFPASIELTVQGGARTLDRLTPVVRRLQQNPWVAEVDRGPAWVAQVDIWASSMRIASLLALALAAVGSLFIVTSSVALALAARQEAIEVERLVGATEAYVRGPLLVEGATVSIVGGLVASGLLLGLFCAAEPSFAVEGPLALLLAKGPLEFLSWRELLTGLATASMIGLGGASIAARHRDRAGRAGRAG